MTQHQRIYLWLSVSLCSWLLCFVPAAAFFQTSRRAQWSLIRQLPTEVTGVQIGVVVLLPTVFALGSLVLSRSFEGRLGKLAYGLSGMLTCAGVGLVFVVAEFFLHPYGDHCRPIIRLSWPSLGLSWLCCAGALVGAIAHFRLRPDGRVAVGLLFMALYALSSTWWYVGRPESCGDENKGVLGHLLTSERVRLPMNDDGVGLLPRAPLGRSWEPYGYYSDGVFHAMYQRPQTDAEERLLEQALAKHEID